MRTALRRSVWFWLGCFVLVFLVWAWADSRKTRTEVLRESRVERWVGMYVTHGSYYEGGRVDSGRVLITWTRVMKMGPGMRRRTEPFEAEREPAMLGGRWLAKPTVKRYEDRSAKGMLVRVYRVEVPMWGIVGLYVVVFCAVMVWWRRRVRTSNIERPTSNDE